MLGCLARAAVPAKAGAAFCGGMGAAMSSVAAAVNHRSVLFVPGKEKLVHKAKAGTGADVVILDLEDSVGVEDKEEAREVVGQALRDSEATWGGSQVVVRVNGLDTP